MPNFCNLSDIQSTFAFTSRYVDLASNICDAVSEDIIRYTRRNFDYNPAVVQYLDMHERGPRERYELRLDKYPVDNSVPMVVQLSYARDFSDTDSILPTTDWEWDVERQILTIIPEYATHFKTGALKVTYAGGFKVLEFDTGVYDCGASMRLAATMEAAFRLESMINREQGLDSEDSRRGRSPLKVKPQVGGLLPEVAYKLLYVRKVLGR